MSGSEVKKEESERREKRNEVKVAAEVGMEGASSRTMPPTELRVKSTRGAFSCSNDVFFLFFFFLR